MDMDGVSERKMSILQSDVIESFLDIDEILGHKELRYFGNRFRRVTYTVNNILISAENAAHLQISIHYPADWSSKKHGQVSQPHLSTVDAAYLASALGEWYKHRIYEIDETQDSNLQLISCEIFSGVTPDENLINLKAEVNELGCEKLKSKRSLFKARSDLSIQLGSMKINIAFANSGKKESISTVFMILFWTAKTINILRLTMSIYPALPEWKLNTLNLARTPRLFWQA